jgi:adenosylhomocysteine nucleosidase
VTIGIVAALPFEVPTVVHRMRPAGRHNTSLLVNIAGVGAEAARAAGEELLLQGAGALISWGSAAALHPSARSGDLVLPISIKTENGLQFLADALWRRNLRLALPAGLRVWEAMLLEVSEVLRDPQAKRRLARQHGAVAADMESAALAQLAAEAGAAFLAVRSICDTVDMRVPACASLFAGDDVMPPWHRVLAELGRRPRDWPVALQLWRGLRHARRTLRQVGIVDQLISHREAEPAPLP